MAFRQTAEPPTNRVELQSQIHVESIPSHPSDLEKQKASVESVLVVHSVLYNYTPSPTVPSDRRDMDAREEINLRVLRQHDPSIGVILKQSPYVVLYSYSLTESSWSKLPFEGTLFVYRAATPGHACGYRILNRLSLECFSRHLLAEEDVMETEGYVIHRSGDDIWGIWIWDSEDRSHIYAAMRDAARTSESATCRDQDGRQRGDGVGGGGGGGPHTSSEVETRGDEGMVPGGMESLLDRESWMPTTLSS